MANISMTPQQVKTARKLAYDGHNASAIANKLSLNYGPVYCAIVGKTWASIHNPLPVPHSIIQKNARRPERICQNCKRPYRKGGTTTRCGACYNYWNKHGVERNPQTLNKHKHTILTHEQLARLYVRYCNGASMRELAEELPFSEETLRRRFKEAGLGRRTTTQTKQKLTAAIVQQARNLVHEEDMQISHVAEMYNINYQTMYTAVMGHTWRGAGGALPCNDDAEKRPCTRCEILTQHSSGICRFCR